VPLEPSGNADSEYVLHYFYVSVNETAMQNVWQHHFPQPWEGGSYGTNWPTVVVEIATFYEFDRNDRFSTAS
jgi:hypothetical protein